MLLKVDCKISVLLGLIQNFEVSNLAMAKVNKVHITQLPCISSKAIFNWQASLPSCIIEIVVYTKREVG